MTGTAKTEQAWDITEDLARKVLGVVDEGLVSGVGVAKPGHMCVEAAVCFALGLPHGDDPPCVGRAVRGFKIRLNDARWPSDAARTAGLRKLAIAQLGSDAIDQQAFARIVAREMIKRVLPIALRAAAAVYPERAEALEAAAVRCERDGTRDAAEAARTEARSAADAAAYAAAYAAADAAAYAADAYAAADAAYAADAADAAADADAYAAADADARLKVLNLAAEIGLGALIELKSPGCRYLYLAEEVIA